MKRAILMTLLTWGAVSALPRQAHANDCSTGFGIGIGLGLNFSFTPHCGNNQGSSGCNQGGNQGMGGYPGMCYPPMFNPYMGMGGMGGMGGCCCSPYGGMGGMGGYGGFPYGCMGGYELAPPPKKEEKKSDKNAPK